MAATRMRWAGGSGRTLHCSCGTARAEEHIVGDARPRSLRSTGTLNTAGIKVTRGGVVGWGKHGQNGIRCDGLYASDAFFRQPARPFDVAAARPTQARMTLSFANAASFSHPAFYDCC
eukprot:1182209-Pleurochrysis_carterae.AAC.4